MNCLRRSSVLAWPTMLFLLAAPVRGEAPQTSSKGDSSSTQEKWRFDRSITASPAAEPTPALAYRLWPMVWERKEGNAVPIYLRLNHEQNDAARREWSETPKKWLTIPLKDIPLDQAKEYLNRWKNFLHQLELGAQRKTAEWNYTLDQGSVIDILLPDAQMMRSYVPMMLLKARVELAEGNYAAAAHWLRTGLSFSQHVSKGPFLINSLVGIAGADQFLDVVLDFVEQPGAPNLYWSLTNLPRPLIDLRDGIDIEYHVVEMELPDLADRSASRSPEEWDAALKRVRTHIHRLVEGDVEGGSKTQRWWFTPIPGTRPEDPASKSSQLEEARKRVAGRRKLSPETVAAMPPAQVLILDMMDVYSELRDLWFKGAYLPYPQAQRALAEFESRVKEAPESEGKRLAGLLPAIEKVQRAQMRVDRKIAALRVIEALRLYAAEHDGHLPDKLSDVTGVPVPNDPGIEKPFEYRREGNSAKLIGRIPGDKLEDTGLRYRLTMK